jgi:hypothetical protein
LTLPRALSFLVIGGMMAGFLWGRFRFDVVAVAALVAAVLAGMVPTDQAFTGFADDIVISAAVSRSGVVDRAVVALAPVLGTSFRQILALVATAALLSSAVKKIGQDLAQEPALADKIVESMKILGVGAHQAVHRRGRRQVRLPDGPGRRRQPGHRGGGAAYGRGGERTTIKGCITTSASAVHCAFLSTPVDLLPREPRGASKTH